MHGVLLYYRPPHLPFCLHCNDMRTRENLALFHSSADGTADPSAGWRTLTYTHLLRRSGLRSTATKPLYDNGRPVGPHRCVTTPADERDVAWKVIWYGGIPSFHPIPWLNARRTSPDVTDGAC